MRVGGWVGGQRAVEDGGKELQCTKWTQEGSSIPQIAMNRPAALKYILYEMGTKLHRYWVL